MNAGTGPWFHERCLGNERRRVRNEGKGARRPLPPMGNSVAGAVA